MGIINNNVNIGGLQDILGDKNFRGILRRYVSGIDITKTPDAGVSQFSYFVGDKNGKGIGGLLAEQTTDNIIGAKLRAYAQNNTSLYADMGVRMQPDGNAQYSFGQNTGRTSQVVSYRIPTRNYGEFIQFESGMYAITNTTATGMHNFYRAFSVPPYGIQANYAGSGNGSVLRITNVTETGFTVGRDYWDVPFPATTYIRYVAIGWSN